MSHSPPPPGRDIALQKANLRKERAALASIAVSTVMTGAKFAAGLASGSLAVMTEAGHNLADVAATVMTYFAIKVANKPADEEHHFGHAKVESLAAFAETGFLFALAVYVLIEAFARLSGHEAAEIEAGIFPAAVLSASIAVDLVRWISLRRIAAETKSDALAADALHFSSDAMSSSLALCGIAAASFGYPAGDSLVAAGLAAFIAIAGLKIGWRAVNALLDAAPKGLAAQVRSIAQSVPGVIGVDTLRLRAAGAEIVGDIGIRVARTLPLERAAAIEAAVAKAVSARHPDVAVKVAAQPAALNDETILERVLLTAAKRHIPVHHVTAQEIGGRTSISFDAELDGRMTHAAAHEIVSQLEAEIRGELGAGVEVESHIEPLEPHSLQGRDAPEETRAEIAAALENLATGGPVCDVHNVRVRATPEGLVVNYHCRVSPFLSVDEVHAAVDALDRHMRGRFARIVRIVGHAEPLRAQARA